MAVRIILPVRHGRSGTNVVVNGTTPEIFSTVTIIGFLTAIIAFIIVRSEQWLFDIKEGYCTTSIWKAKRFCCPSQDEDAL